jgi:hypothetical protein
MFRIRLVLKAESEERISLVISSGFRLIFISIGVVILAALLMISALPFFHRSNLVPLLFCFVCLLASLYLERWIFDRRLNIFERQIGLVFLFKRRRQALDSLRRVLLSQYQRGYIKPERGAAGTGKAPRRRGAFSRMFVTLGVEDEQAIIHRLDIARVVHLGEIRKNARGIAGFCGIPLDDEAGREDAGGIENR